MLLLSVALAAPPSCPGQQVCGSACLPWTEVCRAPLLRQVKEKPVEKTRELEELPRFEARGPSFDERAGAYCHESPVGETKLMPDPALQAIAGVPCAAYYDVGGLEKVEGAARNCRPDERSCRSTCVPLGEECPATDR